MAPALVVWLMAAGHAFALPNGAPWGSANPAGVNSCNSCHFDGEAVQDSNSIKVTIAEAKAPSDHHIGVIIQFDNPENKKVGFQIIASDGNFTTSSNAIEANGPQARSIALNDNKSWPEMMGITYSADFVQWTLHWAPPENNNQNVFFWIAVNAANDDASPFGDQIHFGRFEIPSSK